MASLGLSEQEREAVARFERDVVAPSMDSLIVLQFTADWCGPCKQLSPLLDKVAADYSAKGVKLVRIDVDQEKLIAEQFRIQSVPTVYAIYQGQPVADLTPYRTEAQVKQALDQLLGQLRLGAQGPAAAEIEPLLAKGEQALADGDSAAAGAIFGQARNIAPDNPDVAGALARALIAAGQADEARTLLDSLAPDLARNASVARARASLDLASAEPEADSGALERRIEADPDDHEARFELAAARIAAGDRDSAADALLAIVERDKEWNEGAARKRFLQLLEAQGLEDPWTRAQRRRLSALLFT